MGLPRRCHARRARRSERNASTSPGVNGWEQRSVYIAFSLAFNNPDFKFEHPTEQRTRNNRRYSRRSTRPRSDRRPLRLPPQAGRQQKAETPAAVSGIC